MAAIATVAQVTTPRPAAAWASERRRPVLDQDIQLIERCLGGEEAAWEDLVKIHTRRVYAICCRFTSSQQEAQDLTQEVFLRVFRSLKSFRAGEGSFTVWLARLTRNLLIDHYRRSKLERATDSIEEQLPMIEDTRAMSARADGMLAGREASEALQGALWQAFAGAARDRDLARSGGVGVQGNCASVERSGRHGEIAAEPRARGTGSHPAQAEGSDMNSQDPAAGLPDSLSGLPDSLYCSDVEILLAEYIDGTLPGGREAGSGAASAFLRGLPGTGAGRLRHGRVPGAHRGRRAAAGTGDEDPLPNSQGEAEPGAARCSGACWARWLEPVLQPRLAMGMGAAALSFFMLEPRGAPVDARRPGPGKGVERWPRIGWTGHGSGE